MSSPASSPLLRPRSLYASFDTFPSAKGSSIHIERMVETLFETFDGGTLFTLGDETMPPWQRDGSREIIRFHEEIPNFLERSQCFGAALATVAKTYRSSLEIVHFRDPWSGMPLLRELGQGVRFVYEVNGLPSIELPYHFPALNQRTLDKIRRDEQACWERADAVVAPSACIAENLTRLGVESRKLHVIHNGADIVDLPAKPDDAPSRYIIYFGALQRWQGIETLLRAMTRLGDLADLQLLVCSSSPQRQAKPLRKLAQNLGIADRVVWKDRLQRDELGAYLAHAALSVAPLTECSRNIAQGCCPLKVLESMAYGVPVVASRIPCVCEIVADGEQGRLVNPERPGELARAIRLLLDFPEERDRLGRNARQRIAEQLTWQSAQAKLAALYRSLLSSNASQPETNYTLQPLDSR